MRPGRGIGVAAAILSLAASASAAEQAARPTTVEELVVTAPTTIAELTVSANLKCVAPDQMGNPGERPRVVSTYPARGAVVRPGLLVLRITFDKPMACAGRFAAHPPWPNPCSAGEQTILLSYDRKTVRIACATASDAHYGVSANRELQGDVFLGVAGLPAQALALEFTTSAGPPVASACEALRQDAWTIGQVERAHRSLDCEAAPP